MVNFYEWLGIAPNASPMDIEKAIRLLRQRGDVDEKTLTQARNCLLDPKMRKVYDNKLGIKAGSRARTRSALKADTPFWIPVMVIVAIIGASMVGMYFARQDANEKKQEYQQSQSQQNANEQERLADGTANQAQITKRVAAWHGSKMAVPNVEGQQHMLTSQQLRSPFSVYKEMKLVLALPEEGQAHLVMFADSPFVCEGECRVQLDFGGGMTYALPAQADGAFLVAAISNSVVDGFRQAGQVTVVLPDQDHSQFVFDFPALVP